MTSTKTMYVDTQAAAAASSPPSDPPGGDKKPTQGMPYLPPTNLLTEKVIKFACNAADQLIEDPDSSRRRSAQFAAESIPNLVAEDAKIVASSATDQKTVASSQRSR